MEISLYDCPACRRPLGAKDGDAGFEVDIEGRIVGRHTTERCLFNLGRQVQNQEGWINAILRTFEKHDIKLDLGQED